jgi:hypothetical protein
MSITQRLFWAFMALSLLSLLALYLVPKLLLNGLVSEWDHDKVQQILSTELNRPVALGPIKITIGLSVVGIDADSMKVTEKNGAPFFNCGAIHIELAAIPLLQRNIQICKINVASSETWIERLSATTWNFSDMPPLRELDSITEVKVKNSTVHLQDKRDVHPAQYRQAELQHLDLSLDHHFGSFYWPFHVAMDQVVRGKPGTIEIKGNSSGHLQDWARNKYAIDLTANQIEPMYLSIFTNAVPEVVGKIDLRSKGIVSLKKTFDGEMKVRTDDIRVTPPGVGPLKLRNFTTETKVKINPDVISWSGLVVKVGQTQFESEGSLKDWTKTVPVYDAHVKGSIDKLGELLKHIDSPWIATGLQSLPRSLSLKGSIDAKGVISANQKNEQFSAVVTLKGAEASLKEQKLTAKNLDGRMVFDSQGLSIQKLTGTFEGAQFDAAGHLVPRKNVDLYVHSKRMAVAPIRTLLAAAQIKGFDKFIKHYGFAGKMDGAITDLNARVFGAPSAPKLKFHCSLEQITFKDQGGKRFLDVSGGEAIFDDRTFALKNVKGNLGKGTYSINGFTGVTPDSSWTFAADTKGIDIASLKQAMRVANFDLNWIDDRILSGQLGKASVNVTGTFSKPLLRLFCETNDLLYAPLGPAKGIHIGGGTLALEDDRLKAVNLNMNGPGVKIILTATVKDVSRTPQIERLQLANSTFDIGEVYAIATAPTNPPAFRKFATTAIKGGPLERMKGKIDADVACDFFHKQPLLTGTFGIESLQTTTMGHSVNLTDGDFVATQDGTAFNFKKLTGTIDKTYFQAKGNISHLTNNFQTCKAQLATVAKLSAEDLTKFINQRKDQQIVIKSKLPISVRARIDYDGKDTDIDFSTDLAPDAGVSLTSTYGTIQQPEGLGLKLRGSLTADEKGISLNNGKLALTHNAFNISGTLAQASPDEETKVAIEISLAEGSDINELLGVMPGFSITSKIGAISGTVKGNFHITGTLAEQTLSGNLILSSVAIPRLNLNDVFGTVEVAPVELQDISKEQSLPLNLKLKSVDWGTVSLSNLAGVIVAANNSDKQFELSVQNMVGTIAKGALTINARYTDNPTADFVVDLALKGIDTNVLYQQISKLKNEVSGALDLTLTAKQGSHRSI